MLSTVHPLFNGQWLDEVEILEGDHPKAQRGLFLTHYFPPPDDIRLDARGNVEVISKAYSFSTWFNWLRDAGFTVTRVAEPPAVPDGQTPPYTSDDWADHEGHLHAIPTTIIFVATGRKKGKQEKLQLENLHWHHRCRHDE